VARAFLAEFLGTAILILIGDGSVAQFVLGGRLAGSLDVGFLSVNFAWGIAVAMGVYISAGPSGGHLNPAVSLAMALVGKLSWIMVPVYFLAQYLGAFFGAAILYGVYHDALDAFDGGNRSVTGPDATAGIWATYPQGYLSIATGLGDQVIGTAILVTCVLAITDDKNHSAPKGVVPLSVGLCVFAIGASFGLNCGYAINPARDLGPRIFTAIAGWGSEVFTAANNWAWVPVVGPHIGGIVGAFGYLLLVGIHNSGEEPTNGESENVAFSNEDQTVHMRVRKDENGSKIVSSNICCRM